MPGPKNGKNVFKCIKITCFTFSLEYKLEVTVRKFNQNLPKYGSHYQVFLDVVLTAVLVEKILSKQPTWLSVFILTVQTKSCPNLFVKHCQAFCFSDIFSLKKKKCPDKKCHVLTKRKIQKHTLTYYHQTLLFF